jgi:hypothetical protein
LVDFWGTDLTVVDHLEVYNDSIASGPLVNLIRFTEYNSSTWEQRPLDNGMNGVVGSDNIRLVDNNGSTTHLEEVHLRVANYSTLSGASIGLHPRQLLSNSTKQPLMAQLRNSSVIPSISFGYTAGAHYSESHLVLTCPFSQPADIASQLGRMGRRLP